MIEAIDTRAEDWNDDLRRFIGHQSGQEIVEKVRRGRDSLTRVKSATRRLGAG
ncbi:MAG TPA: hypothetical protein VNF24_05935 [Candidatus Acidoferrales bacterium]|nr:hypothetical protein [Candidatus Acidoferrales bacterium]